jgi:hypothetical protein
VKEVERSFDQLAEALRGASEGGRGDPLVWPTVALHGLSEALDGRRLLSGIGGGWSNEVTSESAETGDLDESALLPFASQADVKFVTSILERTTLYNPSNGLRDQRVARVRIARYSNVGGLYYDDKAAAQRLVDINRRHLDLVSRGLCVFLPSTSSSRSEGASGDWGKSECVAPLEEPRVAFGSFR